MSLERFTEKWTSSSYPPDPVSEGDLSQVEFRFGVRLPEDYRSAVLRVGLPRPKLALLSAIVERELELQGIGNFYAPSEIIESTLAWHAISMPANLIAFASDGMGNKFCFDADRLKKRADGSAAIWFFDHDFETVECVAPSFTAWIEAYCDVEPVDEEGY